MVPVVNALEVGAFFHYTLQITLTLRPIKLPTPYLRPSKKLMLPDLSIINIESGLSFG